MPLPRFIAPAVPALRAQPPIGPLWRHEPKLDGWRAQVRRDAGGVTLLSRQGRDIGERFPAMVRDIEQLTGSDFILDGELVALGADGRPDFDAISRRGAKLCLCLFDIMFDDGEDVRGLPLFERRDRLNALLRNGPDCMYVVETFEDAHALLLAVGEHGLEGIVSKRVDAPYRSGSRCGWVKLKTDAWVAANRERWRHFQN